MVYYGLPPGSPPTQQLKRLQSSFGPKSSPRAPSHYLHSHPHAHSFHGFYHRPHDTYASSIPIQIPLAGYTCAPVPSGAILAYTTSARIDENAPSAPVPPLLSHSGYNPSPASPSNSVAAATATATAMATATATATARATITTTATAAPPPQPQVAPSLVHGIDKGDSKVHRVYLNTAART